MEDSLSNISVSSGKIRLLPDWMINQIAAGEVIERPASVAKELMENALDAGADHIVLAWRKGGKSWISVTDNGIGLSPEDMQMAIQPHTTSKLSSGTLNHIGTFGFRGEALAAIASVARMKIVSNSFEDPNKAWFLNIESGKIVQQGPARHGRGSCVQVQDLFFSTPARLKFMRTDVQENQAMVEMVQKFVLAFPEISFRTQRDQREVPYSLNYEERLAQCFGKDFLGYKIPLDYCHPIEDEEASESLYHLRGYITHPHYHKATSQHQWFFVNQRFVKDKIFSTCLRQVYHDLIPKGRHPLALIFLDMPKDAVDVNVHPAKSEVRFRHGAKIRQLLSHAIKQHLHMPPGDLKVFTTQASPVSLTSLADPAPCLLNSQIFPDFSPHLALQENNAFETKNLDLAKNLTEDFYHPMELDVLFSQKLKNLENLKDSRLQENASLVQSIKMTENPLNLGYALGQIQRTYIVSCSERSLFLVDPHAAHERMLYEHMKNHWQEDIGSIQTYLLEAVFEPNEMERLQLERMQGVLSSLGFHYTLKEEQCWISTIPAWFRWHDAVAILRDLIGMIQEDQEPKEMVLRWRDHIMANWACRQSLRFGKRLSIPIMNQILRDIEKTPNGGQCNHGRPVYKEISFQTLRTWFHR